MRRTYALNRYWHALHPSPPWSIATVTLRKLSGAPRRARPAGCLKASQPEPRAHVSIWPVAINHVYTFVRHKGLGFAAGLSAAALCHQSMRICCHVAAAACAPSPSAKPSAAAVTMSAVANAAGKYFFLTEQPTPKDDHPKSVKKIGVLVDASRKITKNIKFDGLGDVF